MALPYSTYIPAEGENIPSAITIYKPGGLPLTVLSNDANYFRVRELLEVEKTDDIQAIEAILSPAVIVGDKLARLSDNITYDGKTVLYDHDPIDQGVARFISRTIEKYGIGDEDKWKPAVRFLEKLYQNPSEASRRSLYGFLRRFDFAITNDGDFIAYKGVRKDYRSIHAGPGIVDGVPTRGHLLNNVGSTIEIQRSYVDSDVSRGCSTGLHAGTYAYASGFAQGVLLRVRVNPRDVVSVPQSANYQKIRCTRYVVLEASDAEYTETHWDDDEDGYGEDDDWGYSEG